MKLGKRNQLRAAKKLGYNVDFRYSNNKSEKPKMQKQNINP